MPLVLDHVGILTPEIEHLASILSSMTEFSDAEPVVEDPYHSARIQFLSSPKKSFPRLELIEPMGGDSPLNGGLERGGGPHHICFQVASVEAIDDWCRKASIRKVFGPNPAPAFGDGREVVFVHAPGLGLVEFVSTQDAGDIHEFNTVSASPLIKSFLAQRKNSL